MTQSSLLVESTTGDGIEGGVEQLDPVPSVLLGLVLGHVRLAEQVLGAHVGRAGHDVSPDAGRDHHLPVRDHERALEGLVNTAGRLQARPSPRSPRSRTVNSSPPRRAEHVIAHAAHPGSGRPPGTK